MNAPSVLLSMTVENEPTTIKHIPDSHTISFEVSPESLETIIEGLGKIRDQLSQIH